ncbi:MAG: hypothetical protein M3256_24085, partial [Actinomycetota bacterium]|nr:hypothetical protein [Actinomycetota bacterium]
QCLFVSALVLCPACPRAGSSLMRLAGAERSRKGSRIPSQRPLYLLQLSFSLEEMAQPLGLGGLASA